MMSQYFQSQMASARAVRLGEHRAWALRLLAASAVLAGLWVAAGQARAQEGGPYPMPPRAVLSQVSEQGFEPLSNPVRRGRNYVLFAVDSDSGVEMRVVVDGFTGDVIAARPRERGGFSDLETARLTPPGRIPSARHAALPASRDEGTPTPKPRPLAREAAKLPDVTPLQPIAKNPAAEPAPPAAPAPAATPPAPASDASMPSVQPLE